MKEFILQTEHRPLLSIVGSKKRVPTFTANKLQRWVTIVLNRDFKMGLLSSKKLEHADSVSRFISKCNGHFEDKGIAPLESECEIKSLCNSIIEMLATIDDIKINSK